MIYINLPKQRYFKKRNYNSYLSRLVLIVSVYLCIIFIIYCSPSLHVHMICPCI